MSDKWRYKATEESDDEDSQVKDQSHSHRHRSGDGESVSHKRSSSSNDEKRKHRHHHKKNKKDRRKSRSPSPSHSRKRTRSRSRSRDGGRDRLAKHRQQKSYRPENERHSDFRTTSSRRSDNRNYRSRSSSEDRGALREKGGLVVSRNAKSEFDSSAKNQPPVLSGKGLPIEAAKLKEEIERRKQLWSKKEKPAEASVSSVWKQTAFSDDNDGKVSAKFKRLMGMKEDVQGCKPEGDSPEKSGSDKQRQEEYFANLEKQYEVARATTHTQRGLGLGFSSARLLPR